MEKLYSRIVYIVLVYKNIDVTEGSVCEISAVIGETKPYELIFNYK